MPAAPIKDFSPRPFPAPGLAGGVIVIAALAAYYNCFQGVFVFDDLPSIPNNPTIRHLWPLSGALQPPHNATVEGRPLLNLSLAFNYAISGTQVWSYHALNLLIHALAGLTLFGIVRRTLGPRSVSRGWQRGEMDGVALAIAALWTVHPLQTEAVTYIIQRGESLMGLFYLLTLYCFIRGTEDGRRETKFRIQESGDRNQGSDHSGISHSGSWLLTPVFWLSASTLCCFLGMATKEVMASAPVVVFLYDRTFVSGTFREAWRRHGRTHLALACTWILLAESIFTGGGDRSGSKGFGLSVSGWKFIPTQFPAIARYLRLVFWPHPLVFEYGAFSIERPMDILPSVLLVVALAGATLWALRARPALGFLGACFFVILAPSSLTPGIGQMIVEHRMYLPLAAILALAVPAFYTAIGRRQLLFAGLATMVAVLLAVVTEQRNRDYDSALQLWGDTVAKRPSNALARNNLGIALDDAGRFPEAVAQFRQAVQVMPGYVEAQYNLGVALNKMGRTNEAIAQFEKAVQLAPNYAQAHYNLGTCLGEMGRMPEAIFHLQEAIQLEPDSAEAHNNLGLALYEAGRMTEATAQFEETLRLDPGFKAARMALEKLRTAAQDRTRYP